MSTRCVPDLCKTLAVLLPALLAGGCEVDSKGGDGDVRWELSSHPGSTSSNATAQVTASDNTSSTTVRMP